MRKPRVLTRCVANVHALRDERIIEFSFPDGTGGLISFMAGRPGQGAQWGSYNRVNVYRCDAAITVSGCQQAGEKAGKS